MNVFFGTIGVCVTLIGCMEMLTGVLFGTSSIAHGVTFVLTLAGAVTGGTCLFNLLLYKFR